MREVNVGDVVTGGQLTHMFGRYGVDETVMSGYIRAVPRRMYDIPKFLVLQPLPTLSVFRELVKSTYSFHLFPVVRNAYDILIRLTEVTEMPEVPEFLREVLVFIPPSFMRTDEECLRAAYEDLRAVRDTVEEFIDALGYRRRGLKDEAENFHKTIQNELNLRSQIDRKNFRRDRDEVGVAGNAY